MYGDYEYGSQYTVGGSSSQPNPFDDDDFTQMYPPQFSNSFCEEQSPVEENGRDPTLGHAEEAKPKMPNGPEEEATEGKSEGSTLCSMDP
ncbi:hypothetical protein Tco_0687300 [Tanacetum coccineum]